MTGGAKARLGGLLVLRGEVVFRVKLLDSPCKNVMLLSEEGTGISFVFFLFGCEDGGIKFGWSK